MDELAQKFCDQILALAWIRCCMEEGVDFVSQTTHEVEKNENVIYRAWLNQTREFEVPTAQVSPKGYEKNILEVVGSFAIFSKSQATHQVLAAQVFKDLMGRKIDDIRKKDKISA